MPNSADRPEQRSALTAHECTRMDIDISVLSEVCLLEKGSLREHSVGYTPYWLGNHEEETHL